MLGRKALQSCVLLLLAACGCRDGSAALRLWATSDMVRLTERTAVSVANPVWSSATKTVSLFAAANETVSFQAVIDVENVDSVNVSISSLTGPAGKLPPGGVKLFRMKAVTVDSFPAWYIRLTDGAIEPGRFYDALIPVGDDEEDPPAGRFELEGAKRLALWVDVAVPRDARPGTYRGRIDVRSGLTRQQGRIDLTVHDIVLPDVRPFACIGSFTNETIFRRFIRRADPITGASKPYVPVRLNPRNQQVHEGLTIIRQLMRLAHDHRLDLFDKTIHPTLKRDSEGAVDLRWDDYDSIVTPYLRGSAFGDRIGVGAWPAPVWSGWPDPAQYGGAQTQTYQETVAEIIAQTVGHFDKLGAANKLFFWPRTGVDGGGYGRYATFARRIRSWGPNKPILSELPAWPPAETSWRPPEDFPSLVDMYAAGGDLVDLSRAGNEGEGNPLSGIYLRPGAPPLTPSCDLLASPADVRALAWLVMKYRCAGIFLPGVLNWAGAPYLSPAGSGERLFYPDRNRVVASVRLKWLRRGLQDAAYIWLLQQRQRTALAEGLMGTMVHYASLAAAGDNYLDAKLDGWVRQGETWILARRVLAGEVFAAVHPDRVTVRDSRAGRVAWRQLNERAAGLRVQRVHSQLAGLDKGRFAAVISLEVFNEMTVPIEADVRISQLPPSWRAVGGVRRLRLAAKAWREVTLQAEGQSPPIGPDGKMRLDIELISTRRAPIRLRPAIGYLRASPAGRKLAIDGDLTDWPGRSGNAAGGFILLGRRGQPAGPTRRQASRQTRVFALYDDNNLYLAFLCQRGPADKLVARASNVFDYDQLLATGEDLVEVILDPGRRAVGPEDLYHLIVKSSGVVLSERGVHSDPPLGKAKDWPVAAKVAVQTGKDAWRVEMAIPLSSLGDHARSEYWGINFARFTTAGVEASNWSGAKRYYYHPKSLATMRLAPAAPKRGGQGDN